MKYICRNYSSLDVYLSEDFNKECEVFLLPKERSCTVDLQHLMIKADKSVKCRMNEIGDHVEIIIENK